MMNENRSEGYKEFLKDQKPANEDGQVAEDDAKDQDLEAEDKSLEEK